MLGCGSGTIPVMDSDSLSQAYALNPNEKRVFASGKGARCGLRMTLWTIRVMWKSPSSVTPCCQPPVQVQGNSGERMSGLTFSQAGDAGVELWPSSGSPPQDQPLQSFLQVPLWLRSTVHSDLVHLGLHQPLPSADSALPSVAFRSSWVIHKLTHLEKLHEPWSTHEE